MTREDFREIAQTTMLLSNAEAWRLLLVLLAERGVSQRRLCKVRQLVWWQRQLLAAEAMAREVRGPWQAEPTGGLRPLNDFLGRMPKT